MNILITGGAGFIGSHTAESLVETGHTVRVVDDFSTGKAANLAAVADEIEIAELDIRDFTSLSRACEGIEVIFHLAAISSVEKSIDDPLTVHAVNATGSLNVMEAARGKGVRRVILASSAAVYGDHPELPKTEASPVQPLSPYAWQKLTGEFYGTTCRRLWGLEFIALRYFNVYGPRQDPDSPYSGVLSIFVNRALKGQAPVIFGDGKQTRDFINIADVAEINRLTATAPWPMPEVINVATNRETSILDAAQIIRELTGSSDVPVFEIPRKCDIQRSYADNGRLLASLGYEPRLDIRNGLVGLCETLRTAAS